VISVGILNLFGESTLELILEDRASLEEAKCSRESKAKSTVLRRRQQGGTEGCPVYWRVPIA
jgi:hypothetical protein